MPLLASNGDSIVRPEDFELEFTRDDYLQCPHCNREMHFNKCTTRVDHFSHEAETNRGGGSGGAGGCAKGGESREHELMKKRAITELQNKYGPFKSIRLEEKVDKYRADVVGTFENEDEKYGDGICVEVQYKNESKKYMAVTANYLVNDYSVCWVFFDDWQSVFELKRKIQDSFKQPAYIGYTDDIKDGFELGEPIFPHTLMNYDADEVLQKHGSDGRINCVDLRLDFDRDETMRIRIDQLTSFLVARTNDEVKKYATFPPRAREGIIELFTNIEISECLERTDLDTQELKSIREIERDISIEKLKHHLNKDQTLQDYNIDTGSLKIFQYKNCDVCEKIRINCYEWGWLDSSGLSPFNICSHCRDTIEKEPNNDMCPLCGNNGKTGRSEGFQCQGDPRKVRQYAGCGDCRDTVIFSSEPALTH
jgi:hypothetical protein